MAVVDDDNRLRELVAGALRVADDVVEADSTTAALEMLASADASFDVVVVSCLRSRPAPHYASALEFVRATFQQWPSMSLIMLADADQARRLAGDVLLSGVRDVVQMPFVAGDVVQAVARVLEKHPVRRASSPDNVAAIRRVIEFLDEHASDAPALSELAVRATMSRSHFSRTFHAVVGMPLRDYVRDLRLKRAHGLLVAAKLSLTSIAVESGFYDLPHFDKAFRHRLGVSPQEFRSRYGAPVGAT